MNIALTVLFYELSKTFCPESNLDVDAFVRESQNDYKSLSL